MAKVNHRVCFLFFVLLTLLWLTILKGWKYTQQTSGSKQTSHYAEGTFAGNSTKELQRIFDGVSYFLIFMGYPRSGHTLIGSLLDAHPHAIIANEFDVIGKWQRWPEMNRNKYYLFSQLYKNSREEARHGYRSPNPTHRYNYHVHNQWQGRFQESIKVIGTKKGGKTARLLSKQANLDTLKEIRENIGLPLKVVHVVRNPFDNIATMLLRAMKRRKEAEKSKAVNNTKGLDAQIKKYFTLVETVAVMKQLFGNNVLEIQNYDVIQDPRFTLNRICEFLQLYCDSGYLDSCASIVYDDPSKTRFTVVWTEEQKRRVQLQMKKYDFLSGYSFNSQNRR